VIERLRQRQHGQALALTGVLVLLVVLPMLGLAIDAGIMFNTQRKLQMTVDAAARIGAMQSPPTFRRHHQHSVLVLAGILRGRADRSDGPPGAPLAGDMDGDGAPRGPMPDRRQS
jgi:hypothetical protein